VLFYRAALPLSRQTLTYVAGIIRRHRASIGSLWRKLDPARQALLVLAHLHKGETFAHLAARFGVGTATAWRYVDETVVLLAARAPKLRQVVRAARAYTYAVLDGTLILTDRVAADRPFFSGKHRRHGMKLQVIASPAGNLIWVSGVLPGAVHDSKVAWIWASSASWPPPAWSPWPIRAIKAPGTRSPRTKGKANPNPRNRPARRTRNSAPPARAQTRSSRAGKSSASFAAVPGKQARSPRPSSYCRPAKLQQDEKGSIFRTLGRAGG
jgi:hypothetical protein